MVRVQGISIGPKSLEEGFAVYNTIPTIESYGEKVWYLLFRPLVAFCVLGFLQAEMRFPKTACSHNLKKAPKLAKSWSQCVVSKKGSG